MSYNNIGYYDHCCLNCKYWQINTQPFGPAKGVICRRGNGFTDPDDYCDGFYLEDDDYGCFGGGGYHGGDRDTKLSYYYRSL